jgi:hypothetical protein
MVMRPRTRTNKVPGLFQVHNRRIRQGCDPLLCLLEIPTPSGIVHDLLLTHELPDGVYRMHADSITRSASDRPRGFFETP